MRVIIKGGVWTNAEDEILKAAVMKYGLHEWGRVASMLPRKSAGACKSRWKEWLDPRIKKTEWTREEEERLLHLAKQLPTRWRTIAQYMGRTSAQCLEHYQRLLDVAEAREGGDEGKLRPGEIDPAPETRPARPDPVDMNEEEQDMLMEARARLANTKGKKAKRIARQKQLEEARRLSSLQKDRELRAAGLTVRRKRGRKGGYLGGMNLDKEMPFRREAPAGLHDTAEEDERARKEAELGRGSDLEAERLSELHGKDKEEEIRRARREGRRRLHALAKQDLPAAVAAELSETAAPSDRKRRRLELPAPQISDAELEQVGRLGKRALEQQATSLSSRPMRTPMARDVVMEEAQSQVRAREAAFLAADVASREGVAAGAATEAAGTTSKAVERQVGSTPNVLLSALESSKRPGTASAAPISATPLPRGSHGLAGRMSRVPLEDEDDDRASVLSGVSGAQSVASSWTEADSAALGAAVLKALEGLPAPRGEFELAPLVDDAVDVDVTGAGAEEEDEDEEEIRRRQMEEEEERQKRAQLWTPSAVSKHLPVPPPTKSSTARPISARLPLPSHVAEAEPLVEAEMAAMIRGAGVSMARVLAEDIEWAKEEVDRETASGNPSSAPAASTLYHTWTKLADLAIVGGKTLSFADSLDIDQVRQALRQRHASLLHTLQDASQRSQASVQKASTTLADSQPRADALREAITTEAKLWQTDRLRLAAFTARAERETQAVETRREAAKSLLEAERARSRALQETFSRLQEEKKKLLQI